MSTIPSVFNNVSFLLSDFDTLSKKVILKTSSFSNVVLVLDKKSCKLLTFISSSHIAYNVIGVFPSYLSPGLYRISLEFSEFPQPLNT